MDSFFGLFDPSDGQNKHNNKKWHRTDQDNVKKKSEPGKGRRRSRKSVKNETLPEESSFLCEPEISTELLVKDGSYIDSYIELKCDDGTQGADKRPRRRNSGRRSRRKKKVSPNKDVTNTTWDTKELDNLNNKLSVPKLCDGTIGKNVNDLSNYKTKRKSIDGFDDDSEAGSYEEGEVYSVIDKLEKVSLKDDMYQVGDFNTDDLNNDPCYSSDEYEESFDDTSEEDLSGEEQSRLPPEPRFGNVEYKLQLVAPCERKFQHLVTQLKWRLVSGGGLAVYVVGVRDCGAVRGLRPRALRASLRTLRRMARALGATLAHVTARRLRPQRALAEVYVRKLADRQQSVELRVAVMGANEAGKSTLVGVLTQGELDNGRGSARLNMFRHLHEVKSGRTSSLSHEILGFDAQGNVVNYGCSELMTAERIGERSAKLVTFLDLAGHTKYQRTTLHGLTGYSPHHAMLVISATAGITHITEEHIDLLLALNLPFFVVITKCELAPSAVQVLMERLEDLLAPAGKKPLLITDENAARNCVAPQKLILDAIDNGTGSSTGGVVDEPTCSRTAVFPVSCVRGAGLRALHAYLLHLEPPSELPQERCEFQIDEIFHVDESSGPVVGGLLISGCIYENDRMIIGPLPDGSFTSTVVRSVHRNRVACSGVAAARCASVGLRHSGVALRAGLVLLSVPRHQRRVRAVLPCQLHQTPLQNIPDQKNNKNLLNNIAEVESSLNKNLPQPTQNVYHGDGDDDGDGDRCTCANPVYLEDPDDPRGCLYFQASVQVLRHSTAICPGFQCTVHVGNVRQTAVIQGIMSCNSVLRAGESASVVFRFVRCPEYLVVGRRMLFTAGLGTRGIGEVTQTFPYIP